MVVFLACFSLGTALNMRSMHQWFNWICQPQFSLLRPQCACAYGDYAEMHLQPLMERQLTLSWSIVDTIGDTYRMESHIPSNRSETVGQHSAISSKIPQPKGAKRQKLLCNSDKDEWFQFLSENTSSKDRWYESSPFHHKGLSHTQRHGHRFYSHVSV